MVFLRIDARTFKLGDNATMAPDRIAGAIDSLINHLIPNNPNDSEDQAQEQHDRHFELVKSIIRK